MFDASIARSNTEGEHFENYSVVAALIDGIAAAPDRLRLLDLIRRTVPVLNIGAVYYAVEHIAERVYRDEACMPLSSGPRRICQPYLPRWSRPTGYQ